MKPKRKLSFLNLPVHLNKISTKDTNRMQNADTYAHFETDIKSYATTISAFEIGSKGTITPDNLNTLTHIHKYLDKHIRKKTFKSTS